MYVGTRTAEHVKFLDREEDYPSEETYGSVAVAIATGNVPLKQPPGDNDAWFNAVYDEFMRD